MSAPTSLNIDISGHATAVAAASPHASIADTSFLSAHDEKLKLNQYWYSGQTITALVNEIESHATRCCFLSTPSLFFSLRDLGLKERSRLFDIDSVWEKEAQFVPFDYRRVADIPLEYEHYFDYVVIDPPFITEEVWQEYAAAVKKVLIPQTGKILLSTIPEHAPFLQQLLGMHRCSFRPSIPNLIYQYSLYVNYEDSALLHTFNPEIDPDSSYENEQQNELVPVVVSARKIMRQPMESYSSEQQQAEARR